MPVGTSLPGLRELSQHYGVSAPTVRIAINRLVDEGLLVVEARRGTFVASETPIPIPVHSHSRHSPAGASSLLGDTVLVISPLGMDSFDPARGMPIGWDHGIGLAVAENVRKHDWHLMVLNFDRVHSLAILHKRLTRLFVCHPAGVIFAQFFEDKEVAGVVVELARRHNVPLAIYGGDPDATTFGDRVISGHAQGAYELTSWLIQVRHRRAIVFLGSGDSNRLWWMQDRYEGYCNAMREAGLKPLPMQIITNQSDKSTSEAFDAASRLNASCLIESILGTGKRTPTPCDAFLVLSDGDCFSVAAAIRLFGKEPNRDIDIVGYDNYWFTSGERIWESSVPLATVDKQNRRVGEELVDLIAERPKGGIQKGEQIVRTVAPVLVINDDAVMRNPAL